MADSWKTDGNCKECRRREYCNKACSANKKRLRYAVHDALLKHTGLGVIESFLRYQHPDEPLPFMDEYLENGRFF